MRTFRVLALGLTVLLGACSAPDSQPTKSADKSISSSSAVNAATPSTPSTSASSASSVLSLQEVSPIIGSSSHNSMVAVSTFDPHVLDMTGVVVAPQAAIGNATTVNGVENGQVKTSIDWTKVPRQIVFISNRSHVIAPQLIDPNGNPLNEALMAQQGLVTSPAEGLTKAMSEASRSFISGTKGPILTIFMDPNCIFCHKIFLDLEPKIKAGEVRVRYVMVGFLKQDSRPKSATIIFSKDPVKALTDDEHGFNVGQEEGGLKPASDLSPESFKVVDDNTQLMNSIAQVGTPMSLYCDKETKQVQVFKGYPQDLNSLLSKVGAEGHPGCN